jgi:hypothetical protein
MSAQGYESSRSCTLPASLSRLVKSVSRFVKPTTCFRARLLASAESFLSQSLAAGREAMQSQSMLTLGAISLILVACQTPQQAVQSKENLLAAAGFTLQPANSPARIAAMKKLPPNKFVRQTSGGTVVYVYADPAGCQCVYFGDQTAWSNYRGAVFAKQLADEQQMTAMMNQNAFDFGPWGPGFW